MGLDKREYSRLKYAFFIENLIVVILSHSSGTRYWRKNGKNSMKKHHKFNLFIETSSYRQIIHLDSTFIGSLWLKDSK